MGNSNKHSDQTTSPFALPRVRAWLDQFDIADRSLAEYLLKKLRYVSLAEIEGGIQSTVSKLLADIEQRSPRKQAIAIFPVPKPSVNKFNKDKESKAINDSSGRIGHMLKNLERNLPNHIELSPRIESMRERKVKHIIFVDDLIGSGDRVVKSWRSMIPRTIKSWCARGWVKIWLVAYSAHTGGLKYIAQQVKYFSMERMIVPIVIEQSFMKENRYLAHLCAKYGRKTGNTRANLGYGGSLNPIVFQYGCPNNCPGILWSSASKSWQPLFPDRSVPEDLYPLFGKDHSHESTPEELWMSQNYGLAIKYLEKPSTFGDEQKQLSILGYLNARKPLERIRSVMVMTKGEFDSMLLALEKNGLVTGGNLTEFGKDVLKRGNKKKIRWENDESIYQYYFPATFMGFHREV